MAGTGDYALGNGTVCAAISAPEHEGVLSARGGVLIDLGHCGRDDDQWGVMHAMLNLSRSNTLPVSTIETEVAGGEARVIARGETSGLAFTTVFSVDERSPHRLLVRTDVERIAEGDRIFLLGDVVLHGHRQLTAFTASSTAPERSVGFAHPEIDIDSTSSMVGAMRRADTQILVGGAELEPGIAYGWRLVDATVTRQDGDRDSLAHLALNGRHFSILGTYADSLLFGGRGDPGMLELAQTWLMDLEPGEKLGYSREIVLGDRADVASVTDRLWPNGTVVRGELDDPRATLHVFDEDESPITFVRADAQGRFSFRLPERKESERYTVRVRRHDAFHAEHPIGVEPGADAIDLGRLESGSTATLVLPRGVPLRLVFTGVAPTKDPRLMEDGIEFRVGERRFSAGTESNDLSLAGTEDDPPFVRLPPGRYNVLASRGPEWSISETEILLEPDGHHVLTPEPLIRVVDTPGWLSADFHVHAAPSDDSSLPVRQRIASFVAQGADVIVATEHDTVFDYGPTIEAMGLGGRLRSLVGVEITSTYKGEATPFTSGHSNAFPLTAEPSRYRGGAPRAENVRLREIVGDVRSRPGRPVVQLNHPRESGADRGLGSYLSHQAVSGEPFDPTVPLEAEPNRALSGRDPDTGLRDVDFDAIELLNGPSLERYRYTRADWLSWLLQGERRTGTANSDSHSAGTPVAVPRNYVAYEEADGIGLDVDRFMASFRAGRVTGSTGPVLDVRLGEAGPGDLYHGESGEIAISVRRADWVPADTVRVYVDGALAHRAELPEDGRLRVPLDFSRDAFVTVEVEGKAEADSPYARLLPGFTPFAFSNPIFVDADGSGGWTPPGLTGELPDTLRSPADSP